MAYFRTLTVDSIVGSLPSNTGCLIAYSGGADSTALLHILSKMDNVTAIHVNHNINPNASQWQQHCQNTCTTLGIPLIIEQAHLKDTSENSCRKARYEFFSKHLKPDQLLVTAHHAQDQAETILLKLFRGSGLNGLSGMKPLTDFAKGKIFRPLLNFMPEQLKSYLLDNNIDWIEDDSNQNNGYRRNFIRNIILPQLNELFPQVVHNINKCGNNLAESQDLIHYLLHDPLKSLNVEELRKLPDSLQLTVLYNWLSEKNLPVVDRKTLLQIRKDFIDSSEQKTPWFHNRFYQLFRHKKYIYCIRKYEIHDATLFWEWNTSDTFILKNGCGSLKFHGPEKLNLKVRFNQNGEKIRTAKYKITKSVKNLFQENSIPPWMRHNTPFIYHNDKLVSLGYEWSHAEGIYNKIEFIPKPLIL